MKLGVQLYTLRKMLHSAEDFPRLFAQLAALGYEGVEFAGYHKAKASALRAMLDDAGLQAAGTHLSLEELSGDNLKRNIDYLATLGCAYIGTGGSMTRTPEQVQRICDVLGNASLQAKQAGMTAYYHNHFHEFKMQGGKYKLAIIGEACALELDTYWSYYAKIDTPAFLKKHAGNIPLVHIKDGKKRLPKPCALGEGQNDLPAIIAATREIGSEWLIVENDFPKPDGLADVTRSMAYLKTVL